MMVVAGKNDAFTGQMSGIFGHPEDDRAYFYSPEKGIVRIHPRNFAKSAALYLNAEGVAAGPVLTLFVPESLFPRVEPAVGLEPTTS